MNIINITKERAAEVVAKFNLYGRGILIGQFVTGKFKSNTSNAGEAVWQDLVNPSLYGIPALMKAYQFYLDRMQRSASDPEVFGSSVIPVFVHVTQLDEEVPFTAEECFIFVRAALLEQKRIQDLKNLKQQAAEAQAYLEQNKGRKERKADAEAIIAKAKEAGVL